MMGMDGMSDLKTALLKNLYCSGVKVAAFEVNNEWRSKCCLVPAVVLRVELRVKVEFGSLVRVVVGCVTVGVWLFFATSF